ncbi:RNA polymerase sigma-54 factor [Azospirillum brasilense]|uniref:RNA polymerase sigma-54 factor n=1 Tax=Azospirillum brasilense TaxID=192 RepID=Q59085_AZOBR|nr:MULTISPECIES: RNA polymerase factor sigma-54 [Azospirillum]ALJ37901.1 RNA polymerase sigma-54 factor [Azospirillum brasilense]MDW7556600.1 RNA polymerase factor sigma-54 [Azospirillum brasilense]MDW7596368.1 RNA polymerase factor sigma-54 [Azospirillum brasilense]MDW7631258.1 RNA polymerase factor sigma-54 [Azospirillum brasilense]MDX5951888.1 RNA polymerase factor sigma-54 [Azospirillum brasilense]
MALSQRLDLRQSQSLVMTPQLQQAIKLLQLSNIELSDFVDREIEQNPLLERDGGPGEGGGESGGDGAGDGGGEPGAVDLAAPEERQPPMTDGRTRDTVEMTSSETMGSASDAPLDTDFENVYSDDRFSDGTDGSSDVYGSWQERGGRGGFEDDESNLEATLTGQKSLRDHLTEQLKIDLPDLGDQLIGLALIDMLDEAGWITGLEVESLAGQLGCAPERVERVLAACQRFDPPGIFARSLKECLAIQLREKNRFDPAMEALLDHLELLAARNLPALMKVCGVDAEDVADMVAEIRKLNPKPALSFDHTPAQLVTPDILMRANPGGGWLIDLNPDTLPRVLVNHRYFARISGTARNKADKEYITERFQSANWLVKSLHQRATTILKVASEIIRQQDAFFIHGVSHLKPLILRDIAEAIGMHESTVSRVTTNKFMATPRGVFELKYFFTSAIQGADGQAAHSAEAVRYRIKAMIDAEKPDDVLSDDKIVEILRGEGIDIARRTVAKYREAMRIPSSVQRRRAKMSRM